ncbi:proline-rich protein HaeIII subfamily 1-like [Falco cherrug]|uniref:proline-rich protein HaeIII subfamily 1-like n=1 Tax=Falco cherrug TaxID=345164 RepID=UPI002479127B|nr:proline-rich protein HaeIII subfamily 1-like [Falco cherrug]
MRRSRSPRAQLPPAPPPPSGRQGASPLPPEAPLAAPHRRPAPPLAVGGGRGRGAGGPDRRDRGGQCGPALLSRGRNAAPPPQGEAAAPAPGPPARRESRLARARPPPGAVARFAAGCPEGARAAHVPRPRRQRGARPRPSVRPPRGPGPTGARRCRPRGCERAVSGAPGCVRRDGGIRVGEGRRWHREESITEILGCDRTACRGCSSCVWPGRRNSPW